jgi:FkbM family methyltransferase
LTISDGDAADPRVAARFGRAFITTDDPDIEAIRRELATKSLTVISQVGPVGSWPSEFGMSALSTLYQDARFFARCLRYRVRTERFQLQTLLQLNLTGATALDIGANKGIYCYWMRRAVGASGRIVAFDPQPEMCLAIADRRDRLGWRNLRVLNVGLSDSDGQMSLAREKVGDGSASLESSRRRAQDEVINVPVTRLDAMADDLLTGLAFIKCDVEGHERNVFLGGEAVLRRYRPVVQFESTVGAAKTDEIFAFFRALGYSGVMLSGDVYLPVTNPDAIPHYKFGLGGHRDYVFFPPEAIGTTIPLALARKFPA